jgi:signal transduction histidine kinase
LLVRLSGWADRRSSIRTQLIAWNIIALALLLAVLGLITDFAARSFMMNGVDAELDGHIQHLLDRPPPREDPQGRGPHGPDGGIGMGFDGPQPPPGPDDQRPFAPPRDGFPGPPHGPGHGGPPPDNGPDHLYLYDLKGQALDRRNAHALLDGGAFTAATHGAETFSTVPNDGEIDRVRTRPLTNRQGETVGVVQAYRSLTEVNQALQELDRALLALIPVGLLGAGMAGSSLTDRVLRRLRGLTHAAGRLSARNLADRLPVIGNDEFSELADTFNGLLGRLESAFAEQQRLLEHQRRFTADASHELKTPLTIIKGNTSMALDEQPKDMGYRQTLLEIDQAADTMSSLVQDLLLLARSDGGQLGKDRIELLVREVLERAASAVAHHKGAPVTLQIEDDALSVPGNEGELVRLFTNLLDNATRHTPPEGHITVRAARQGDRVVVSIADTGMGIAPEHLSHLGERFYRVDASRSRPTGGTGLGLSICKSIVEAHRGAIDFQSKLGVGTTVIVSLPTAT